MRGKCEHFLIKSINFGGFFEIFIIRKAVLSARLRDKFEIF